MAKSTTGTKQDSQATMEITRVETGGNKDQKEEVAGGILALMGTILDKCRHTTSPNIPTLLLLLPPTVTRLHTRTNALLATQCHEAIPLLHSRDLYPRGGQSEVILNVKRLMVDMIFIPGHTIWTTDPNENGVGTKNAQEYFQNPTHKRVLRAEVRGVLNRKKRARRLRGLTVPLQIRRENIMSHLQMTFPINRSHPRTTRSAQLPPLP